MHPSFVPYRVAGAYIAKRLQDEGMENPEIGIICGSGLSELSKTLDGKTLTVRFSAALFCFATFWHLSTRMTAPFFEMSTRRTFFSLLSSHVVKRQIKYADIPGFPHETTVVGHKGEAVIGQLAGVTTICFRGRFHCYEGHPLKRVVLPGE